MYAYNIFEVHVDENNVLDQKAKDIYEALLNGLNVILEIPFSGIDISTPDDDVTPCGVADLIGIQSVEGGIMFLFVHGGDFAPYVAETLNDFPIIAE